MSQKTVIEVLLAFETELDCLQFMAELPDHIPEAKRLQWATAPIEEDDPPELPRPLVTALVVKELGDMDAFRKRRRSQAT